MRIEPEIISKRNCHQLVVYICANSNGKCQRAQKNPTMVADRAGLTFCWIRENAKPRHPASSPSGPPSKSIGNIVMIPAKAPHCHRSNPDLVTSSAVRKSAHRKSDPAANSPKMNFGRLVHQRTVFQLPVTIRWVASIANVGPKVPNAKTGNDRFFPTKRGSQSNVLNP